MLPGAPPITQRNLIELLQDLVDGDVKPSLISPAMLWSAGLVNRELREAREVVAQFDRPYITDAAAFETAVGSFVPTAHRESLARTLAWAQNADDATPAWR